MFNTKEVRKTVSVPREWRIHVANPSTYERSDYVDVDLDRLSVPRSLGEGSLRLFRLWPSGSEQEIPYQIDYLLGKDAERRALVFKSERTPPGPDDYSRPSAEFALREGVSAEAIDQNELSVAHYHKAAKPNEAADGFNRQWEPGRPVNGVKLLNGCLEVYFSLVPHIGPSIGIDYTGSATSIGLAGDELDDEADAQRIDLLSPFEGFMRSPKSRWGQLSEVVFFPTPWDTNWFTRISLLNQEYDLVWSNAGPVRAVFTMRSKPMAIRYKGGPFFQPNEVELSCYLYRVFYVFPQKPFYNEEIFLRTEDGHSLSFRPYYFSYVPSNTNVERFVKRFEHIPDYFAVWLHWGPLFLEYGFASDAHVRWVKTAGDEIHWRLPHTHHHKNTHLFRMRNSSLEQIEWFHDIGHFGWYERVFKPLEVYPLANRYALPAAGD
jgi:hypothetical protein